MAICNDWSISPAENLRFVAATAAAGIGIEERWRRRYWRDRTRLIRRKLAELGRSETEIDTEVARFAAAVAAEVALRAQLDSPAFRAQATQIADAFIRVGPHADDLFGPRNAWGATLRASSVVE